MTPQIYWFPIFLFALLTSVPAIIAALIIRSDKKREIERQKDSGLIIRP